MALDDLSDKVVKVLRVVAQIMERAYGVRFISDYPACQLDSISLAKALQACGYSPSEGLEFMLFLEKYGYITRVVKAEESGGFSNFVLTEKGMKIAAPEFSGELSGTFVSSIFKSIIFSLGLVGILGGPIALAATFSKLIKWDGNIGAVVNFWENSVSVYIHDVLSFVFGYFGIKSVDQWVADYFAMGLIFSSIIWAAMAYVDEVNDIRSKSGSVIFRLIFYTFLVVFWPVLLPVAIYFAFHDLYLEIFKRPWIHPSSRALHSTLGALIFFFMVVPPVFIFLVLLFVQLFMK